MERKMPFVLSLLRLATISEYTPCACFVIPLLRLDGINMKSLCFAWFHQVSPCSAQWDSNEPRASPRIQMFAPFCPHVPLSLWSAVICGLTRTVFVSQDQRPTFLLVSIFCCCAVGVASFALFLGSMLFWTCLTSAKGTLLFWSLHWGQTFLQSVRQFPRGRAQDGSPGWSPSWSWNHES